MVKCIVCKGRMPEWRIRDGFITCSKKCSNAWNWIPWQKREKIRGKRYNIKNRPPHKT